MNYVLNAIQFGILSWLICGHIAITMKAEALAVERTMCMQNLALWRLTECRPLICLEHGASLKLK